MISGSKDKTIRISNLQTKLQEAILQGHTDSILVVAIKNDSQYIISSESGTSKAEF